VALSTHERLICVPETAVPVREVGAAGTTVVTPLLVEQPIKSNRADTNENMSFILLNYFFQI
jgi:hypothetical protein